VNTLAHVHTCPPARLHVYALVRERASALSLKQTSFAAAIASAASPQARPQSAQAAKPPPDYSHLPRYMQPTSAALRSRTGACEGAGPL